MFKWLRQLYGGVKPLAAKLNAGEIKGVNRIWSDCLSSGQRDLILKTALEALEQIDQTSEQAGNAAEIGETTEQTRKTPEQTEKMHQQAENLAGYAIAEIFNRKKENCRHIPEDLRENDVLNIFQQGYNIGDNNLCEQIIGQISHAKRLMQARQADRAPAKVAQAARRG